MALRPHHTKDNTRDNTKDERENNRRDDIFKKDLVETFADKLIKINVRFTDDLKLLAWENRAAALLANQISNMLHQPDELSAKKDGFTIWKDVNSLFNEQCKNNYLSMMVIDAIGEIFFYPMIHMNYFYMTILMNMDEEVVNELVDISEALSYDNGQLTAASSFPGGAIALMAIAKRFNEGYVKKFEARHLYNAWIRIVAPEWDEVYNGKPATGAQFTALLERYILG